MECVVCNVRSASHFCGDCKVLVCDECGAPCEECSRFFCSSHITPARDGRLLCAVCSETSSHRRHRGIPHEHDGFGTRHDDDERNRARAARAQRNYRPWKISLILAGLALLPILALMGLALLKVSMDDETVGTVVLLAVVPMVLAAAIGLVGLMERLPRESRWLNLLGIALAGVGVALAFLGFRMPARPEAVRSIRTDEEKDRHEMSPEELEKWRQDMLQRYKK